ncbi:MAG: hypothetical protein AAFS10_14435, partial [Myxococcota bacterium]
MNRRSPAHPCFLSTLHISLTCIVAALGLSACGDADTSHGTGNIQASSNATSNATGTGNPDTTPSETSISNATTGGETTGGTTSAPDNTSGFDESEREGQAIQLVNLIDDRTLDVWVDNAPIAWGMRDASASPILYMGDSTTVTFRWTLGGDVWTTVDLSEQRLEGRHLQLVAMGSWSDPRVVVLDPELGAPEPNSDGTERTRVRVVSALTDATPNIYLSTEGDGATTGEVRYGEPSVAIDLNPGRWTVGFSDPLYTWNFFRTDDLQDDGATLFLIPRGSVWAMGVSEANGQWSILDPPAVLAVSHVRWDAEPLNVVLNDQPLELNHAAPALPTLQMSYTQDVRSGLNQATVLADDIDPLEVTFDMLPWDKRQAVLFGEAGQEQWVV